MRRKRERKAGEVLVSVIMPVYNAEAYVWEAVASVLGQTFSGFELIVADDASTDGSWRVAARFTDPRIRRLRHGRNLGAAATRNRAVAMARGEFIAFLDADDVALPMRLERQVKRLRSEPGLGLVGSQVEVTGASGGGNPKLRRRAEEMPGALLLENCLALSTVMVRRGVLPPEPFRTEYEPAEDYELWSRMAPAGGMANLEEAQVRYRVHPGSASVRHAEGMRRSVRRIAAVQLERLGLRFTEADLELHVRLADWPVGSVCSDLWAAERWLRRLGEANRGCRVYGMEAFGRVLAERWCSVCCASWRLGLGAWLAFWQSPLRRGGMVQVAAMARLFRQVLGQSVRRVR